MDTKDLILSGIMAVVICVPVLGITARIAMKPIVDSIIRLRESYPSNAGNAELENRVLHLENHVRQLNGTVAQLEATVDFQQKLLTPPPATAVPGPAGTGR